MGPLESPFGQLVGFVTLHLYTHVYINIRIYGTIGVNIWSTFGFCGIRFIYIRIYIYMCIYIYVYMGPLESTFGQLSHVVSTCGQHCFLWLGLPVNLLLYVVSLYLSLSCCRCSCCSSYHCIYLHCNICHCIGFQEFANI